MPHSRTTTPSWHPSTLRTKRAKHQACFADILGIHSAHFPPGKFEILAGECYETPWLAYEADCRDSQTREFVGARRYFVDPMLGVAVTTKNEAHFITYFHEDFDLPHGVRPPRNSSSGQRELEYRRQLDLDVKSTKMRSLKPLAER
jgi:hypothetical protein